MIWMSSLHGLRQSGNEQQEGSRPIVLKYPANHIRVLDQADDPHLRTALRAGQGIDLPDLFELDHLFGMTAWAEPPVFAAKCQEIFMVAVWIRAPDPGEAFLQVSALQVVMYYIINNCTKEAVLFLERGLRDILCSPCQAK
jgi:hypothetical protein